VINISIIIPFLNEEDNLSDLVVQLNEYALEQEFKMEAIFVDDGSSDSSVQVLRTVESNVPIKLVRLSKNYGSHAAIRAGITQAQGEYTMFFSADMQEPFSMIGELYEKACQGYEIVVARKAQKQVSFSERLFSGLYTILIRKFALKDYPKGGANNFLFNKNVREHLCNNMENNSSIHMQIINMGFNRTIVDVSLSERNKGKSKWTLAKKIKLLIDSFIAFSYMPIRAISILGMLMFVAGLIYVVWIIIAQLTGLVEFDAGFPTIISVLLIGFGLTNFALGIVAEYVWRAFDAARGRPVFIVSSVEQIT
jgi:dolichol-phosphate mannosyltransferase